MARTYVNLSEKEKNDIIKRYLDCGSMDRTAREMGVSSGTVKRVVKMDSEFENKFNERRKMERKQLYGYISAKTVNLIKFADIIFNVLEEEDTIKGLVRQDPEKMVRVFGMLFDRLSIVLDIDDATGISDDGNREITVNIVRKKKEVVTDDSED